MNRPHYYARIVVLLTLIAAGSSRAQEVTHLESAGPKLAERWSTAEAEAGRRSPGTAYWIGYSIQRLMEEHSFIGRTYSDRWRNRPSLGELITGMRKEGDEPGFDLGANTSMSGMISVNERNTPARKVMKEVAFLVHFDGKHEDGIDDLSVSNLSLRVDLEGDPLLWIGSAEHGESVALLTSLYKEAEPVEVKKELMMAVGLHEDTGEALGFLKSLLRGSERSEVREEAAFWIGQMQTGEALTVLTETARSDKSDDVREKAIFAMSQMEGEASTDALIDLARHNPDLEMRKKATFWLGQKASSKAVSTLKELVYNDDETEIQQSALFALTQIEDGGAVDELIRIATTHANPRIRKEAIFWLGQSDDPKALQALIDIVKK